MNEGFEQFLATIIEQCLDEHDIQAPLVVRTVGNNGSVLVVGINEGAELVVLTKHGENDTFTLPMKVTIVSQDHMTARLVIERDGNIGRFH
jgi:3-dehydroquinate synthase class II